MTARETHISTKLVLELDARQINGKKATKRVTISGLREGLSADALWELVSVLGKLLEYPMETIKIHTVSAVEMVAENGVSEAENMEAVGAEAVSMAGLQVNGDTAAQKGLRHDGQAAVRAFGGRHKNGLLIRSYSDAYLQEPRLSACNLGNDRAQRASPLPATGSAAAMTGAGCQRLHNYDNKNGLPPPPLR